MARLSSPLEAIQDFYEVVVIGSGYGGGIAASRLARAGRRVCLLERGREIQPSEYPDTASEALEEFQCHGPNGHLGSRTGLFDVHVDNEINVVVGCGLGGTSLINANVSLEPKPALFEDPAWPQALRADRDTLLKEGFDAARAMLKPTPLPKSAPRLPKAEAHRQSAAAMGHSDHFYHPPINVTFERLANDTNHVGVTQLPCNHCGDCVSGCNNRAKNTTLMNYLPDAWNHGAEIFCQAAVSHLEKSDDGWLVHFQNVGTGREKFAAPTQFVRAEVVVLAAGTLGSNEILLRSRQRGLAVSDMLGRHFTGNGDILGFGYDCEEKINGIGFGDKQRGQVPAVGPCITSIIDLRDQPQREQRMVIEEGSIPGALGKLILPVMSAAASLIGKSEDHSIARKAERAFHEFETLVLGPHHGAVGHMQTYLIMSHDDDRGTIRLNGEDRLEIEWPKVGLQPNFIQGNANLRAASEALEGIFVPNPIWSDLFKHSVVSVHPLGGCVMGEDASSGVVNHKGQVFSGTRGEDVYENLYVSDGSVIPTSLAVNPLLTISAVAERTMALLAKDRGWSFDYSLPSRPRRSQVPGTLGVQFTETMTGFMAPSDQALGIDLAAYERAYDVGKAQGTELTFTVTVHAADLDRLIEDPAHPATIVGTVIAESLHQDPLTVTHGSFNLFQQYADQVDTRHMNYRMRLTTEEGRHFFFSAFKSVPEDHGPLQIWHDTSTLYVTLHDGEDEQAPVTASGVMHIRPKDFAKQMTTMKVTNATSEAQRLKALARFGGHFAGVLWESYGNVLHGARYFDPDAPPRKRRQLRVDAPTVHWFKTADGVNLRLSRYRGGEKGPVMLVHGAGVASNIFSIDTIDTNLLEFLYAHGYDVWLLDYRISILLEASKQQSDGDQIATYDFPAAIEVIRSETGAADVQAVVHCYGATTFFMSLLGGLKHVRSVVCSQVATDLVVPTATAIKTGLHIPDVLERLGIQSLTAATFKDDGWVDKLFDKAMTANALAQAQGACDSPVCHRITFLYASLYRHDTLNQATHEHLHEMFGVSNIRTFEHLARLCRKGTLVDFEGNDAYMPHLDRLSMPICFISGADNACYLPESTARAYERVTQRHGADRYSRHLIPGYGHIDCIFGKHAYRDVYPIMLEHLEKTAKR